MSPSALLIYTAESAVCNSDTPSSVTQWVALTEDTEVKSIVLGMSHNQTAVMYNVVMIHNEF